MRLKQCILFSLVTFQLLAQQSATEAYIKKWHKVAIAEMEEYGIPASITLAQGILESGSGQSFLATEAKNHFGIKCHLDWKGGKVYHDDDAKGECFRKYKNAEDSFRDHSLFLKNRSRYAGLFEENPTDYKAWAKGLRKAGYATDRRYADRLIDLIERYQLHKYDLEGFDVDEVSPEVRKELYVNVSANHVEYVVAREGDSFESIALLTDKKPDELLEYNELRHDAQLKPGDIVYLQPKRRKSAREHKTHVVKEGETMYSIAQKFAIRLEELYERNGMYIGEEVKPGQSLELR